MATMADRDGLKQEEAAERMGVSRPTFTRIVGSARQKVARALCDGVVLRIAGGNVEIAGERPECRRGGHGAGHDHPRSRGCGCE